MALNKHELVEGRLLGKEEDWGLTKDSIAQAPALMTADGVTRRRLSDEHLFLYAKLILRSRSPKVRKVIFEVLDDPSMAQANERLTRIVTTGETSPQRSTHSSFFDAFVQKHTEWAESETSLSFSETTQSSRESPMPMSSASSNEAACATCTPPSSCSTTWLP
jgi:hypothetical protein